MNIDLYKLLHIEPESLSPKEIKRNILETKAIIIKKVSWLLVLAYTLLVFKPLLPIVADVMAHTFWEKQHLASVHEVKGKFHLHYDLINASRQTEKDKQNAPDKYDTEWCVTVNPLRCIIRPSFSSHLTIVYSPYLCAYCNYRVPIVVPPPKATHLS